MFLLTAVLLAGCSGTPTGSAVLEASAGNIHEVQLDIKDMYCQSCALGVEYEIKQLDGVITANVDYKAGTGVVTFNADKVTAEQVAAASTVYAATVVSVN